MDGNQNNYWGHQEMHRECFGLSADMDPSLTELQQQQTAKQFNSSISVRFPAYHSDAFKCDGDQVVPSSQRRVRQKEAKPLPPLPDPEDLMSDEAADSEVEFFTSDRQRLLPKSCPKAITRSSNRDCGQINYAYQGGSLEIRAIGSDSIAFSWPSREDRLLGRGSRPLTNNCNFDYFAHEKRDSQHDVSALRAGFGDKQSEHQASSRNCFSCSGPPIPPIKPQIPPRIPIPPKPSSLSKPVSNSEDEKPPKVPPRVPLVPPCPPRTPSPKSLPIYINGVMPVTQSFAANPNYVSKALQRQQSERAPPAAQFSPCIVPILKDGKQASATHYILLPPGRPAHAERRGRILSEPDRTGCVWQKR
ncbi:ERBB receptor feedback inhibitor 1 [Cyprinodon tularosa]|uniref:ERBB receptor feedback inhibitor 1 n=1 Tax=Cyprinodon tularosa TaxID=77115 RepID=UPI0018E23606|nr:ERBB receptor feedback inhibitor 1 [Cyprinodon tularosa]